MTPYNRIMSAAAWGVLATFLAVLVALFKEDVTFYVLRWRHPKLCIGPFDKKPPLSRRAEVFNDQGAKVGFGCYINIPLTNTGRTLARRCQPVVTACWTRSEKDGWRLDEN